MDDEPPAKRARVRQACQACRDAKLRCDLGDPGEPKDPPCQRCSRSGRECRFVGSHLHHKPRKMTYRVRDEGSLGLRRDEGSLGLRYSLPAEPAQYTRRPSLPSPDPGSSEASRPARSPYRSGINLEATIETPADALRVLVAAADEETSQYTAVPTHRDGKIWNQWEPVRDGLLTTEEARTLLAFYAVHLGPLHPVVPTVLLQTKQFTELLDEPILLAAICLAASRFCDLGPSYVSTEPLRSRVIQGRLVEWLMSRLGYLTMGDPTFRTIGTVEALLVLSEWPPRALLLKDPSRARASTLSSACKLFDDLAWTLTGLALRIAQELSLHDEKGYSKENEETLAITRRKMNAWIHCLAADRHVSVRLGRVSMVQAKMSTNWWETWGDLVFVHTGSDILRDFSDDSWRSTQAVTELTHNLGLVQELMYASPSLTNDLIRTRQFEPLLHRLKPELDSIRQWLIPSCGREAIENENEAVKLRNILMRLEIDYIRLYANSISMRAAHHRLAPRLRGSSGTHPRVFESSVLRWAEAPFLLEAVESGISLMRAGIDLHRRRVLCFCPGRTFLRMMFASVFLMKAMSFGAVVQDEADMVNLQYDLIDALREAAVDEDHIALQLASLLSRLFPSRPKARSEGVEPVEQEDPLSMLNFDFGNVDMNLFGDIGVDAGNTIGYNPNGLVSFIEAMLDGSQVDGAHVGGSHVDGEMSSGYRD
ncbi:hypothetical protein CcaverHIS002_0404310 [Cutaneotrichosporon cavernicola]|uniref:Zn(2)-C6 fungal-type domain-containing protein n=1 Tax=Cutaneotrichosporon cavernicola TaxID=279322 RepID=A0AA48QVS5_9TREE|nr:uncharacterized protein CcaverHIS019_0404260 [Cutaneotrichosporon cavernicola]BEI83827.1 hypothetical protein CcaverHIS002_0404310 [Cutaneotrichosporon cavernicola]BEI91606.1 hypothetical protein CcaverHIS019_0404260 [Cutaneotrichosporon cavernicola]